MRGPSYGKIPTPQQKQPPISMQLQRSSSQTDTDYGALPEEDGYGQLPPVDSPIGGINQSMINIIT